MIKLTRLGGEPFILNADLIRYVEARPDTFITLTIGDRIVVEESMEEVLRRTIEYQRSKHLVPDVSSALPPNAPAEPNRDVAPHAKNWSDVRYTGASSLVK
jgi:flagellar protein FlbD